MKISRLNFSYDIKNGKNQIVEVSENKIGLTELSRQESICYFEMY